MDQHTAHPLKNKLSIAIHLAVGVTVTIAPGLAMAANYEWIAPSPTYNNWFNADNWDQGSVPGAGDNVWMGAVNGILSAVIAGPAESRVVEIGTSTGIFGVGIENGGSWQIADVLILGAGSYGATGYLNIRDDSFVTFTAPDLDLPELGLASNFIVGMSGGEGYLNVSDTARLELVNEDIVLGRGGAAYMSVSDQAQVSIGGALYLGSPYLSAYGSRSNLTVAFSEHDVNTGFIDVSEIHSEYSNSYGTLDFNSTGEIYFTRDGTATGEGVLISGHTAVTLYGFGTTVLTSNNTYTGGTTIYNGTLQIGNGGTSGSIVGNVSNNSILAFNRADDISFDGSISGGGSLEQRGTGILTLTGTNIYRGGTTVSVGVLRSGGPGALVDNSAYAITGGTLDLAGHNLTMSDLSGAGHITLGSAALFVDGRSVSEFAGLISGNGNLNVLSGQLTLTGNNSYSGGTTINMSTLQLGKNGTSGAISGDVVNNGTLVFNRADDFTFDGLISGVGSIEQRGSGTVTLTANSNNIGPTTVANGTLWVNGAIVSDTTVNNGATLGGNGSVGNVTLNAGGSIAPGNSIGTLNIVDVDFSAGGVYQVEVDAAGNSDMLIASGTATLSGGTVQVLPIAGSYNYSTDYTILSATGGLNGRFNTVSSNLAFLDPNLSYDANNVYLNLTRNDVSFTDAAVTSSQIAVASALTTALTSSTTTSMNTLADELTRLTAGSVRQAYDSLSGMPHTNAQNLMFHAAGHLPNLLSRRSHQLAAQPGLTSTAQTFQSIQLAYDGDLAQLQLDTNNLGGTSQTTPSSGLWITPQGGTGSIDSNNSVEEADYHWHGLYGGADTWFDNRRLVGMALGYSRTKADASHSDLEIDTLELVAYSRWLMTEHAYLDAQLGYADHNAKTNRQINIGTIHYGAKGNYNGHTLLASVETGYTLPLGNHSQWSPFIKVDYNLLTRDSFTETGADGASLAINREKQRSLRTSLGSAYRVDLHRTNPRHQLSLDLRAAWVHEFGDASARYNAGFNASPTARFNIDGPDLNRNRLVLSGGLTQQLAELSSLHLGYDGELSSSNQQHSINVSYSKRW